MIELDITTTNRAIDRLLERTENPRDRADVLTPAEARALLDPLIEPLPPFDDA